MRTRRLIYRAAALLLALFASAAQAAPTDGYTQCSAQDATCVPLGPSHVIYGIGATFTAPVAATFPFLCNNDKFGNPALGILKACWIKLDQVTTTTVTPGTWSLTKALGSAQPIGAPAADLPACAAAAASSPPGTYRCSTAATVTISQATPLPITLPEPGVMSMHGGLNIDPRVIPPPAVGSSKLMLGVYTDPVTTPVSDIGAFRTECDVAKLAFDDPIVYPGQPGKSHLHTYFGNTGVNANSTPESLRTTGNSTCRGGIANRTAYWVPTIIDVSTGVPVLPRLIIVYYKTGYELDTASGNAIRPMPQGLRMIAGDPSRTTPGGQTRYACSGPPIGPSIPDCAVGVEMVMNIDFPQCWDGVNLDSPDHKSHMAYPVNHACPTSHPVALPLVSYQVFYPVRVAHEGLHWRLSSDAYSFDKPAGYSGHADWFNGWMKEISDAWGTNCVKARRDCHSDLLGDGRSLY